MLLENIRNFDKLDLDYSGVQQIRDSFITLVNEELRHRKRFEEKIRQNLINKGVEHIDENMNG